MQQSQLVSIDTNSADDSKGIAFGLSGNLYIPVVFSGLLSILLLSVLLWNKDVSIPMAFIVSAAPFTLTLFVVKTFWNGQKPHHAADLYEQYFGPRCFSRNPYRQPEHPYSRRPRKS